MACVIKTQFSFGANEPVNALDLPDGECFTPIGTASIFMRINGGVLRLQSDSGPDALPLFIAMEDITNQMLRPERAEYWGTVHHRPDLNVEITITN